MAAIGPGWAEAAWIEASWIAGAWGAVVAVGLAVKLKHEGFTRNIGRFLK